MCLITEYRAFAHSSTTTCCLFLKDNKCVSRITKGREQIINKTFVKMMDMIMRDMRSMLMIANAFDNTRTTWWNRSNI